MKALPVLAIAFIESILFLGHWFIYRTLVVFFAGRLSLAATLVLRDALFLLAFTFVAASLLGFRFANPLVSLFYKIAAIDCLSSLALWEMSFQSLGRGQSTSCRAPGPLDFWVGFGTG